MVKKTNLLELKLNRLEQNEKLNNICIFGLKENEHENTKTMVTNLINDILKINMAENNITKIYRVGKINKNKIRPIIVQFSSIEHKLNVIKNRKLLKGKKVFITEDLTKHNQNILKEAQEKLGNKNVWTYNCTVYTIYNEKFTKIESPATIEELISESKEDEIEEEENKEENAVEVEESSEENIN